MEKNIYNDKEKLLKRTTKILSIIEVLLIVLGIIVFLMVDDDCFGLSCLGDGFLLLFLTNILLPCVIIIYICLLVVLIVRKKYLYSGIFFVIGVCAILFGILNVYQNVGPIKENSDLDDKNYIIYKDSIYYTRYLNIFFFGEHEKTNIYKESIGGQKSKKVCSIRGEVDLENAVIYNNELYYSAWEYTEDGALKKLDFNTCKTETIANKEYKILGSDNNYLLFGLDNSYNKYVLYKYDLNKHAIIQKREVKIKDVEFIDINDLIVDTNLDSYYIDSFGSDEKLYYNGDMIMKSEEVNLIQKDDDYIIFNDSDYVYTFNKSNKKIIKKDKINIDGYKIMYSSVILANDDMYIFDKKINNYKLFKKSAFFDYDEVLYEENLYEINGNYIMIYETDNDYYDEEIIDYRLYIYDKKGNTVINGEEVKDYKIGKDCIYVLTSSYKFKKIELK